MPNPEQIETVDTGDTGLPELRRITEKTNSNTGVANKHKRSLEEAFGKSNTSKKSNSEKLFEAARNAEDTGVKDTGDTGQAQGPETKTLTSPYLSGKIAIALLPDDIIIAALEFQKMRAEAKSLQDVHQQNVDDLNNATNK